MTMEPPGAQDERRLQQERLSREEAYYHFINSLTEEEYRLMRDGNLLGTPGEVTAEELRQRLNGAKEQLSQPQQETHQQGRDSTVGESRMSGTLGEASQGDSLLEWLNTFRRTGNTTRSGQSGNQTWRAVSRTNPNSGEFRFSLEININHERLEPGEPAEPLHSVPHPDRPTRGRRPPSRRALGSATLSPTQAEISASAVGDWFRGEAPAHNPPMPLRSMPQRDLTRARWVRGQRSESGQDSTDAHLASHPRAALQVGDPWSSRTQLRRRRIRAVRPPQRSRSPLCREASEDLTYDRSTSPQSLYDRPQITSPRNSQSVDPSNHHLLSSGNPHQTALSDSQPAAPQINPVDNPSLAASSIFYPTETQSSNTMDVSMETGPESRRTAHNTEISELPSQTDLPASALVGSIRRHPTIMLDLQVRRIRPGESRDRDSVASRTRSRLRMAENTVTFESDSGGFRRTISRSERAGVRTYISTIRIPLRRISETGLGEPNSAALRSILRQIMTGFGELSSLMETEADVEAGVPRTQVLHSDRGMGSQEPAQGQGDDRAEPAEEEELAQMGGAPSEGQMTGRDTNLVENGTLPILRLAHFFLLNDEEDEEHPRGLTKEQIDNLSTRTYGQAGLEADMGRACSVCISEYAQGNKLRRLPCSHEFHVHCIDRWLSENNTCPICRQSVLHAHRG